MKGVPLLLAALVLTACGGTGQPAGDRGDAGTLEGVVLSAPTCPVERPGTPCPPRPVAGAEVSAEAQDGGAFARTRTDDSGHFSFSLTPGSYRVTARNVGGFGSEDSNTVTVTAGARTRVRLVVDSGIR